MRARKRTLGMHKENNETNISVRQDSHRSLLRQEEPIDMNHLHLEEAAAVKKFVRRAKKIGTENALEDMFSSRRNIDSVGNNNQKIQLPSIQNLEEKVDHEQFAKFWKIDDEPHEEPGEEEVSEESEDQEELEEREKTRIKQGKGCLIIPLESNFKFFWDHLNILMMVYVATLVPYRICFLSDYTYPVWDMIDNFVDFLFFLDLIFNFFTPIIDKEVQIKSNLKIALDYLKFWFWMDSLSVFPFGILFSSIDMSSYSILLKISKTPRLYKFMKGAKMLRTIKMSKKGKKTMVSRVVGFFYDSDNILLTIIPVYLLGILMAHLFACIWYFVSSSRADPGTWISRGGFDGEPPLDLYITSVYYIYTTFTTCGYGDIVPGTLDEHALTIIFMGIGVTFLSFVYTTMIAKLEAYNERFQEFNEKKILLKRLQIDGKLFSEEFPNIYKEMVVIIDEHLENNLKQIKPPMFKHLKPRLHQRLIVEICIKKFGFDDQEFIQYVPRHCWGMIFDCIEERIYSPGDTIFEKGISPGYIFLIKKGSVWFQISDKSYE